MEKNSNRNVSLDIVRALCVLEIVAFWHSQDYIDVSGCSAGFFVFGGYLTLGVLSTFAFLSGFFLSKYQFGSIKDVWFFYKKRLERFWFLFFVASLLLYVTSYIAGDCWYKSPMNFINSLLGLTVFAPPTRPLYGLCR